MKALLKFEFRKLFQNKAFYICLGIAIFLLVINTITSKVMADINKEMMEEAYAEMGIKVEYSFSALALLKAVFNSNVAIVEGVVVSIIVCEDFAGDIIKNIYSKGYKREQVFFAKLLSSLAAFLMIIIGGMIISFLLGVALTGQLGSVGKNFAGSVICIYLVAIAYFAIYYAIAIIFKKVAPSIVLTILGPTGVTILLILANLFIKNEEITLSDYWISGVMTNLSYTDVETKSIVTAIIVSTLVIAGFGCLAFFMHRRKDVK